MGRTVKKQPGSSTHQTSPFRAAPMYGSRLVEMWSSMTTEEVAEELDRLRRLREKGLYERCVSRSDAGYYRTTPFVTAEDTYYINSAFADELVKMWGSALRISHLREDLHAVFDAAHARRRAYVMGEEKKSAAIEVAAVEVYDAKQRQAIEENSRYLSESTDIVNLVKQEPALDKLVLAHTCEVPADARMGVGTVYTCGCGKKWYLYKRDQHVHRDSYDRITSTRNHCHLRWRTSRWFGKQIEVNCD